MKKLLSLTLAILMLLSLSACGSAEKKEDDVDLAAKKVAAYVETNQEDIVSIYSTFASIAELFMGSTINVVAVAEDRSIVIKFNANTDMSASPLEDSMAEAANPLLEGEFNNIHKELPELESIKFHFCDKDGNIIMEFSYNPQEKPATNAQ